MPKLSASTVHRSQPTALIVLCVVLIAFLFFVLGAYLASDDKLALFWVNRDFANYWIASRLVLDGQINDLFSGQDAYFAHMTAAFGADYPWHNWSYPPHYLLLVLPLGTMPFGVATVVFLGISLVVFCHAAWCFDKKFAPIAVVLLVPFCLSNIFFSQNGFLISALMLYGLAFRGSHPVLAGVAFALLTVKPQLGLLIPVLLIAERRFMTIAVTCVAVVVLFALTVLLWGMEPWRGYLIHNVPYQRDIMMFFSGIFLNMMPTFFGALRSLEVEASVALYGHIVFALGVFVVFLFSLKILESDRNRAISLLLASFLISPYSLVYDLGALSVVTAILFADWPIGRRGQAGAKIILALLSMLPVLNMFLAGIHWPIGALIIALAFVFFLLEARRMPQGRFERG